MDLSKKKCIPCEGGIPPLDNARVEEYQKHIHSEWRLTSDSKISREYSLKDYRNTIGFVNRVADLAEEEGHHPVMHVYYSKLVIELWTYAIGGLSENDFILAAKIDKL
jgi:4a-hydroxytetrahydrobiopterin dehydratase